PAKRVRTSGRGTASQPVELEESQQQPPRASPRKALAIAASQATKEHPFESQLRDLLPEDAPTEPSRAATEATTEDSERTVEGFDVRFKDDFEGIDWKRLPGFIAPLRTYKHKKSWIYRHGYRVSLASDPSQIWFICKYCHQHRRIDCGKAGRYNTTKSTTAAAAH
ncbi:hypothetical protein CC80DRAFT_373177, partial [Byssothecium circinans]